MCNDVTWNIVYDIKKNGEILFLPRGSGYINYSIFMWCNAKKEVELMEKKNYPLHCWMENQEIKYVVWFYVKNKLYICLCLKIWKASTFYFSYLWILNL